MRVLHPRTGLTQDHRSQHASPGPAPYAAPVALLIDTPRWAAHGRLWAHLVSDTSLNELHAFAALAGIPERSFEGDHYDVPAERHADVVGAGARLVEGRELVKALQRSGLRVPKLKGEHVLATWADPEWPPGAGSHRVDCLASRRAPTAGVSLGSRLIALDDEGRLGLDGDRLPQVPDQAPRCGYLRVRVPGGAPTSSWSHLMLYTHRGVVAGLRYLPQDQVSGVEAQVHWWPLLMHLQRRRPG